MAFTANDIEGENPSLLETVEEYLYAQNWHYLRPSDEEIFVEIAGDQGTYKLFFVWDDRTASLQICCELDVTLQAAQMPACHTLLAAINNRIWLGHFDTTTTDDGIIPCFRYTGLYRGLSHDAGGVMVNGLVQLAITECDRTRQAFVMLGQDIAATDPLYDLAIAAPAGQG